MRLAVKTIKQGLTVLFVAVLGLVLASSYQVIARQFSETVELKRGDYVFEVPRENSLSNDGLLDWFRRLPGLDDGSRSTLVRYTDQEIQRQVPSYRIGDMRFRDDIGVLVEVLNDREIADYQHSETYTDLGDLWRDQGSYKNRRIEPDEKEGWYRVYREIEYPKTWALLSTYPDETISVPKIVSEFWVARCLMLGPKENRIPSCTTHFMIDDIFIGFSISDYNLAVLPELKEFFKPQVTSWIQES